MITIVDGVVEFDRESDPDDMRIYVDPEENIDVTLQGGGHGGDRCMQDAEFLFHE